MSGTEWLADAVIYQVFLPSIADGNGDGIGDVPGATGHLDRLQRRLGAAVVDAGDGLCPSGGTGEPWRSCPTSAWSRLGAREVRGKWQQHLAYDCSG